MSDFWTFGGRHHDKRDAKFKGRGVHVTFRPGEPVRITFGGKTVSGQVLLASASGLSLALVLDEYLGNYINLMPVLWIDDGYVDLLHAQPVTIFRLQ